MYIYSASLKKSGVEVHGGVDGSRRCLARHLGVSVKGEGLLAECFVSHALIENFRRNLCLTHYAIHEVIARWSIHKFGSEA